MKFEEILPLLRQGNKVRRQSWLPGYIYIENGLVKSSKQDAFDLRTESILAEDWEPYCPELTVKDLKEAIESCPDDAKVAYSDTWNHPLFGVIYDRVHNVVELCDKLRLKEYYADSKYE